MKNFTGYLKLKLGDSYVLLAGGGQKNTNDFMLYSSSYVGGRNLAPYGWCGERDSDNEYIHIGDPTSIYQTYGLGWYTIQFDIRTNVAGSGKVYSSPGYGRYVFDEQSITTTTSWQHKVFRINVYDNGRNESSSISLYFNYGSGANIHIKNFKLEKGRVETSFSYGEDYFSKYNHTHTWDSLTSKPAAIGNANLPIYWNGSGFVLANTYPTKSSWNYDDVYVKKVEDTMTGSLSFNTTATNHIEFTSSTYYTGGISEHMSIGYGRIQSWGLLRINADTDNSGSEYCLITSGKGVSDSTADGLAIGLSTLTWLNNTILHAGNSSVSGLTITINGISTTWLNTWRGIQDNLTSTSTTDSLSAYQGKVLNDKFGNYVPKIAGTGSVVAHKTSCEGWAGVKIKIPGGYNSWMITFTLRIYSDYNYTDIVISGYHYGDYHWFAPAARVIGGTLNFQVVMGYVGDIANSLYVWFGHTSGNLGYGGFSIMNLHAGHSDGPDWYSGWTIENIAYSSLTNKQLDTATVLPSMEGHTHTWDSITSKPFALGSATLPIYWNGSGFTACTTYANASVNYATSAGNADTVDGYDATDFLTIGVRNLANINECGERNSSNEYMELCSPHLIYLTYGIGWYTVSFDIRTDVAGSGSLYSSPGSDPRFNFDSVGFSTSTSWQHKVFRINVFDSGSSRTWSSISVYFGYGSGAIVHVKNFKLEKGRAESTFSYPEGYFTINYNNNSNSTYQMLWGSGNAIYGTAGIYCNPYSNNVYAASFYTTSDRTKKKDISSLSEHIKKFTLKDTNKQAYGVIAQEVPEIFRDGEEGNMTVNYSSVLSYYVGLLENKVSELSETVKELAKEISKLKDLIK